MWHSQVQCNFPKPGGRHACRSDANDKEQQQQQCIIHANELQYQDDVSTGALIRYVLHLAVCCPLCAVCCMFLCTAAVRGKQPASCT